MEERENMCCDTVEVHEELLNIVNETMPEETELYDLAELFKVFGDSTRIRILFVLFEAEVCVCDLALPLSRTSRVYTCTSVPTFSPSTSLLRLPLQFISNTMIGIFPSLHRANAV